MWARLDIGHGTVLSKRTWEDRNLPKQQESLEMEVHREEIQGNGAYGSSASPSLLR